MTLPHGRTPVRVRVVARAVLSGCSGGDDGRAAPAPGPTATGPAAPTDAAALAGGYRMDVFGPDGRLLHRWDVRA